MKTTRICIDCGQPTLKVNEDAVRNHAEIPKNSKSKWTVCVNPACDAVYISENKSIKKGDLKYRIFFKEQTSLTPVCYCAGINREDISKAVESGCKTINQVRKFTEKKKKGDCKSNNPLGKSCTAYFNFVINQYLINSPEKL